MLKAVIFDMDGVLVDSEPLHARAAVAALTDLGFNVTIDYCYQFIGSTTVHMLESMKKDYNISLTVTELLTVYQETLHKLIKTEGYEPIPYTKALIMDLYNHGVKLAIASSSSVKEIEAVVKALGIKKYFTKLVSGTKVSQPKPAPDIFLKAAAELGMNTNECIIIEDSFNGVSSATAAGIPVIGYVNEHSGKQDLSAASILIEGFNEINYKFIENIYLRAHNIPITIAITNRLIIRELSINDIPDMYQIYQNPEVKKYIPDIDEYLENEIEKHKAYIKNVYNFYGYGLWGVFSKETGDLIGRCGIQNNIINGKEEIELGYVLDVNHWGYGYAIECIKAILTYAFQELHMERIVALIHPLNTRSVRVAERVNMKKEQVIKKDGNELLLYIIDLKEFI
ncbi:MAG: GNAT family N-acetyltransferase [Anaerocolumna sp.]